MPATAYVNACHQSLLCSALPLRYQQPSRGKHSIYKAKLCAIASLAPPGRSAVRPQSGTRRPSVLNTDLTCQLDRALQLSNFECYLSAFRNQCGTAPPGLRTRAAEDNLATRHQQLIRLAVHSERLEAGLELLQLVPRHGHLWTLLLKEVTAKDSSRGLQKLLQARQTTGLPLDSWSATDSLKAAGDSGDKKLVSALLEQCWAEGCVSNFVFNAAIQAFARCGDPQAALQVYEAMQLQGIQPNVYVYNSLISVAGSHDMQDAAEKVYTEMLQQGIQPTEFTFSLAFRAFCGRHHHKASWILQVANSMPSFGVQMNEFVVVPFLNAMRNSKLMRGGQHWCQDWPFFGAEAVAWHSLCSHAELLCRPSRAGHQPRQEHLGCCTAGSVCYRSCPGECALFGLCSQCDFRGVAGGASSSRPAGGLRRASQQCCSSRIQAAVHEREQARAWRSEHQLRCPAARLCCLPLICSGRGCL